MGDLSEAASLGPLGFNFSQLQNLAQRHALHVERTRRLSPEHVLSTVLICDQYMLISGRADTTGNISRGAHMAAVSQLEI